MKAVGCSLLALVLSVDCALGAESGSSLPSWTADDFKKLEAGELEVGVDLLAHTAGESEAEADALPIEPVEEKPALEHDPQLAQNALIDGVYLERYFGAPAQGNLVDPQSLLSAQESADIGFALGQHAENSPIPVRLYLFDSAQQLAEEYGIERVYAELYEGEQQPAVLVYYYLGDPGRTEMLLAGGAAEAVPEWQVRELLWNAKYKAEEKAENFAQLDSFIGQMSMRLFWVEEILSSLPESGAQEIAEKHIGQPQPTKAEKLEHLLRQAVVMAGTYLPLAACAGVALCCLAGLYYMLVTRRRYHFPLRVSPKRLGGEVGGRFGGVLSYYDENTPVAEQKRQFKKSFF